MTRTSLSGLSIDPGMNKMKCTFEIYPILVFYMYTQQQKCDTTIHFFGSTISIANDLKKNRNK